MFAPILTPNSTPEYENSYKDTTIRINKVGGGEVGHVYTDGYWEYMVLIFGQVVMHSTDLHIGYAATHHKACKVVLDLLVEKANGHG